MPALGFLVDLDVQGIRPGGPGVTLGDLRAWESRHGFRLPQGLSDWLLLADGLEGRTGPIIHPLRAIGPMIRFVRAPGDPVIQPESWYEFGNPGSETVCLDLAYSWPGGDAPVFASGDDRLGVSPRIIATGFDSWFYNVIRDGGRAYWQDPGFASLGDPWTEHRRRTPAPILPDRLRPLADAARAHLNPDADERRVASELGISTVELEALFRYLQHLGPVEG
jgi:hypothetical protein